MDKDDVQDLRDLVSSNVEGMDSQRVLFTAISELDTHSLYLEFLNARISLLETQVATLSSYLLDSAGEYLNRFEENEKATKEVLKNLRLNEQLKEYGRKIQHRLVDS